MVEEIATVLSRDSQTETSALMPLGKVRSDNLVEDLAFAVNVQFVRVPGRHERLAVIPEREYELMLSVLRHKQASRMRSPNIESVPVDAADAIRRGESPVRALRKAKGLKAAELARLVGLTPSMLSQMETTGRSGSVATLYRLSLALSVPMEVLISGQDVEKTDEI